MEDYLGVDFDPTEEEEEGFLYPPRRYGLPPKAVSPLSRFAVQWAGKKGETSTVPCVGDRLHTKSQLNLK